MTCSRKLPVSSALAAVSAVHLLLAASLAALQQVASSLPHKTPARSLLSSATRLLPSSRAGRSVLTMAAQTDLQRRLRQRQPWQLCLPAQQPLQLTASPL